MTMKFNYTYITVALAATCVAAAAGAAEIRVYKQPNFAGEELTMRRDASNLADAGFQDQVSSIEVRSGRWQLCTQPDFQGDCVVIGRGDYPSLERVLNHRIESAREITRMARDRHYGDDRSRYAYRGDYYADNRRDRDMQRGMRVWGD
jgi:hypothetical protein